MSFLNSIVIYFVIWWICLFIFLPIEVSKQKNILKGNDPGAPENPKLKKKFLLTTLLSFVVWFGIFLWFNL